MAENIVVGRMNPLDLDSISAFDNIIQRFEPGELGQIDLPLDPEIAADQEYNDFYAATNNLNNELYGLGLDAWPGQDRIAYLMWRERKVRILFQATQTSAYTYSRTPSAIVAALFFTLFTRAGARMAASAAFRNYARTRGYSITQATTAAGRMLNAQQSRLAYKSGVRARAAGATRVGLPSLKFMVVAGTLLFFALATDQFIEVLKIVGDKAKEIAEPAIKAAEEAAKALAKGVGTGALYAVGGILVVGGIWTMLRKDNGP
jgi:hypothetical protein